MNLDFAIKFFNECHAVCHKDEYNILLNKHLGDLFYIIQASLLLQTEKNTKVHFIVNPQHRFLMDMFNIDNYTVLNMNEFKDETIKRTPINKEHRDRNTKHWRRVFYESNCYISLFTTIPVLGIPIVPDSLFIDFNQFNYYWCRRWFGNLGLPDKSTIREPNLYPELTDDKITVISQIAPLDKIVLVAPEALSATQFSPEFWQIIVTEIQNKGYTVFVNSKKKKYLFKNTHSIYDFDLTLQDVIALGMQCAYVFSLRSGLNDVLVSKHEKMYCFYPAEMTREVNGLNVPFNLKKEQHINEILVSNYKVPHIYWENIDLSINLNKFINKQKSRHKLSKINQISALFNKRVTKYHKLQAKTLKNLYGRVRKNNNEEIITEQNNK